MTIERSHKMTIERSQKMTYSKYLFISFMLLNMYSKNKFSSDSSTWRTFEGPLAVPWTLKILRSLCGSTSVTETRLDCVSASTLLKYFLVKCDISLRANASAIQPSTLALLRTVDLSFLSCLSIGYIHRH